MPMQAAMTTPPMSTGTATSSVATIHVVGDDNADQSTNDTARRVNNGGEQQQSLHVPAHAQQQQSPSSAQTLAIPASDSDDVTMPPMHANDAAATTTTTTTATATATTDQQPAQEEIPVARLVPGISHGSTDTAHLRRVAEEQQQQQQQQVEEESVRREFARRMSNMTAAGQDHLPDAAVDVVISVEPVDVVPIPHEYDQYVGEGAGGPYYDDNGVDVGDDYDDVSSSISGSSSGTSSGRRSSRRSLTKSEREKQKRRRRRAVLLAVAGLVLVAIVGVAAGIAVSVGASSSRRDDAESSTSSLQPQESASELPSMSGGNEDDHGENTLYTKPIDLSQIDESRELIQLREVLLMTTAQQNSPDMDKSLLYDRTTPQYRALYWLANEDVYYETQLLPRLLDADLPEDDKTATNKYHVEERILQRHSLAVVYFATSSDGGWGDVDDYLSPKNECDWSAVSCKDKCEWLPNPCDESVYKESKWAVTSLSLERNNLQGQIPLELLYLTELVELQLQNNHLSGSIPSQIANLSELDRIDLSRNDLTGTLPEEIGTDADRFGWRYIYLSGNRLTGTLPPAWPFAVHELFLHGNMLSGTVPYSYAELRQISHLRLEKNFLTGSINFLCESFATGVQLFADIGEVECRCCAGYIK